MLASSTSLSKFSPKVAAWFMSTYGFHAQVIMSGLDSSVISFGPVGLRITFVNASESNESGFLIST